MLELARASCFQKYKFNAPLKVSECRVDNLLLSSKHLFLTIDFRNKERARDLHLNGFLVAWLMASSLRVPAVRRQLQTKAYINPSSLEAESSIVIAHRAGDLDCRGKCLDHCGVNALFFWSHFAHKRFRCDLWRGIPFVFVMLMP